MKVPEQLAATWEFVIRVFAGIVGFVLIGAAACVLRIFTTYAETNQLLPSAMLTTLRILEYFIFIVDLVVFVVFLVKEALAAMGVTPRR